MCNFQFFIVFFKPGQTAYRNNVVDKKRNKYTDKKGGADRKVFVTFFVPNCNDELQIG